MVKPISPGPADSDRRPTVLVVEDDRELRIVLARTLDAHGWHVVTAGDGLTALQIVDEFHVDAIVSDLHLPGPTGEMLLEYAKRRCPRCKLILLSGWVTRRARTRAEAVGATIFEKPVNLDVLLRELGRGHEKT